MDSSDQAGKGSLTEHGRVPTIVQRIQSSVTNYPNDLAVISTHQAAGAYDLETVSLEDEWFQESPYIRWTYHSLYEGVRRLTECLAAQSLQPGSSMFLICPNMVEYLLATLSAYNLDMTHVPMNPDDLLNTAEVKHKIATVLENDKAKSALFIVDNPTSGEHIDWVISDLNIDCFKVMIDGSKDGWVSFASLMDSKNTRKSTTVKPEYQREARSVFFTSGTTSLPKGCLIKPERWMEALELSLSIGSTKPGDFVVVPVPNSHAYGYICLMMSLIRGACVVFAGPKFTAQHMLEAIERERCTYAALVPTMAHALIQVQSESAQELSSLKGLLFAAASISPEFLKQCQKSLGASTVESYYGMTEGVFCSTGATKDPEKIAMDERVSVGRPVSGSQIRVCAPGESTELPNGSTGELHFSGSTLIDGYIGLKSKDFYTSDGQLWFITGDKGCISSDGSLFLVGRYKDLIIRGGENINPAKIEGILSEVPRIRDLDPKIIGAPDPIAGEIPVAVIREDADSSLMKELKDVVRSRLGNIYVPSHVISLQTLGFTEYPCNPLGKLMKPKLVESFGKWQSNQFINDAPSAPESSSLQRNVIEVWARVLGLQVDQVDTTTPISQIADSIILLIARDRITKITGRTVPLSRWLSATTIAEQVSLLEQIEVEKRQITNRDRASRPMGPPNLDRIAHLGNDAGALANTKAAVEDTISSHGLSWNDVEDVFPCSDFLQLICKSRNLDTWNIRTSILSKEADSQKMRSALEIVLANNPLLLSFIVIDDIRLGPELGLYATIRQSKSFLDRCIQDYGTVDTVQDVRHLTMHHSFKDDVKLPGPCFSALIVFVRETNSAALITNISHAVLDVVYHSLINEDIDAALSNKPLSPHGSYKAWADSYHALRQSPIANTATKYYVAQLQNLKEHKNILWPSPTEQLTVSPERADLDGHSIVFAAKDFLHLRNNYPRLTVPATLKAALALLVVSHTNHTHALFLNLEANRSSFPFIPDSYSSLGSFDATDVAGPTFTGVLNLIEFLPNETVLDYLSRVQETQIDMTQHACAPWHEVFRHLDCSAGEIIPAVAESLIFNWMPGLGAAALGKNPHSCIEVSQTHIRTKLGMLASAGLGGPGGSQIVLFIQGALSNMSTEAVSRIAEDIKRISLWLAAESSWQKPVRQYTDVLQYA